MFFLVILIFRILVPITLSNQNMDKIEKNRSDNVFIFKMISNFNLILKLTVQSRPCRTHISLPHVCKMVTGTRSTRLYFVINLCMFAGCECIRDVQN